MRPVLFLDIDGVLNTGTHVARFAQRESELEFDPAACEHLYRILTDTECAIVISSAWRGVAMNRIGENLRAWDWVKGSAVWGAVIGKTPDFGSEPRGLEISAWLHANHYLPWDGGAFVIVDDDDDMVHLLPHLHQTDPEHGITAEIADAIIAKLRGAA